MRRLDSEGPLQNYMKALPAVSNWATSSQVIKAWVPSMLGGSAEQSVDEQSSMANTALSMMIKSKTYTKSFASITNRYGFSPERVSICGF
ncbi:hypothetical protein ACOBV9_22265 (plasmid) [Pseudoalteromonas espejiana]